MMTQQLSMPSLPLAHGLSSIDHYIQAVHQIPMLTAEEELELSVRYRDRGDLDAARKMVMAHLRFVVHVARGYQGYGLAQADLIQEGNIGLMKAVKRFDPTVGVRLVSFAVHWIKAEIHEFILRNWRIVKVATTKAQRKLFFNLRRSKQRLGWMNADEVATVARELGVETAVVSEMEARLSGADIAFDAPLGSDDESSFAPIDYLEASNADPARSTEASNWDAHNIDLLDEGIENLDPRSQDIIRRRWLVEPKATLQELADEYRVSAERIRQLEVQALKKLRARLSI